MHPMYICKGWIYQVCLLSLTKRRTYAVKSVNSGCECSTVICWCIQVTRSMKPLWPSATAHAHTSAHLRHDSRSTAFFIRSRTGEWGISAMPLRPSGVQGSGPCPCTGDCPCLCEPLHSSTQDSMSYQHELYEAQCSICFGIMSCASSWYLIAHQCSSD